jgi:hypothetical protein
MQVDSVTVTVTAVTATPTATPTPTPLPTSPTPTAVPTPTPVVPLGTLYGSDQLGNLFTVNITSGVATPIGPPGTLSAGSVAGIGCCTEIEYDPTTGRAWAQDRDGAFVITEFSIDTGALIGRPRSDGGSFNGLEYVGVTLYGAFIMETFGSTLATLDPTTGVVSAIGLTGVDPLSGLAWDSSTATMYAVDGGPGPANLYTVNLATGAVTPVGNTGLQLGSLQFGPDGQLYAGGSGANAGDIYTIAVPSGVPALVGNYGLGGTVTGLTLGPLVAVPTPTPAPTCEDLFPVVTVHTMGKGQSPSNNPKVFHWVTGHIQNPGALGDTAHRIPVCPGTSVIVQVADQGGLAINTANSANITCDDVGCFVNNIQATEKYISRSQDGSDTDRMSLILAK